VVTAINDGGGAAPYSPATTMKNAVYKLRIYKFKPEIVNIIDKCRPGKTEIVNGKTI
jgi:hypothetical protein